MIMKITPILTIAMSLSGPFHHDATQYILKELQRTDTTNIYFTEGTPTEQPSYAYYSYYATTTEQVGPLTAKTKAITTVKKYVDNNDYQYHYESIFYARLDSNGYNYTGQRTLLTPYTFDPNFLDYVRIGWTTLINTQNGYDLNYIESAIDSVYNTFTQINGQIDGVIGRIDNTIGPYFAGNFYEGGTNDGINTATQKLNERYNDNGYIQSSTIQSNTEETLIIYSEIWTEIENATQTDIDIVENSFKDIIKRLTYTIQWVGTNVPPTVDVIDIPGLMFTILGMPFAWISTAFNLTLFPGTAYAINISHIFMAVIGVTILIFIIKKII